MGSHLLFFCFIVYCLSNIFYQNARIFKELIIFIMSFTFSFDIISAIVPYPNILWISLSATEAAAINPSGTNTLLVNGWCIFFTNGKPTFSKQNYYG